MKPPLNGNSFRLKLALLSALISGGLLIGVGIVFWQLVYRMDLDRIDREIRNLGTPHLERVVGGDHWIRFENALRFVAGTNSPPTFILWVKNEDRVVHRSSHWPDLIDPETFPPLLAYESGEIPKPGELPPPPRRSEPISPSNPALPRKAPQFYTREADGRTWRIGVMGTPYSTLILGADLKEFTSGMRQLRNAYLAALPAVLLLVAAGAWFIASRALRPVKVLTTTVEGITAQGLDQRLTAEAHEAEFARLITVFNQMMDRLEKSFHQANRFSADASHELKTPLTILQGEFEAALQNAPDGSEQQRVYSVALEEIQRLKSIVQKLLLLSLADSGELKLDKESTDLGALLQDVTEDLPLLAGELKIETTAEAGMMISADRSLLRQALLNLLNNAIKYNQPDGRLSVALTRENGVAVLRIGNTGEGIPAANQPRIFERFYRADQSHSRRIDGVGLGLSLSREIIRAHQGELVLESSANGWTVFRLNIPLA